MAHNLTCDTDLSYLAEDRNYSIEKIGNVITQVKCIKHRENDVIIYTYTDKRITIYNAKLKLKDKHMWLKNELIRLTVWKKQYTNAHSYCAVI